MIVLSMIVVWSLTGCSGGGTLEVEEKEVTLKILIGAPGIIIHDAEYLNRIYGDAFRKEHPHIKLEYEYADVNVVPTYYEGSTLIDEVNKYQPDLIVSSPSFYKEIAQAGLLREISGPDTISLYPPVIEYIKTIGGSSDQLYGVTDEFFLPAIEYNKKLFDRYQVEYPTDGMSWEEIFQLAGKFPRIGDNNKKLYGLDIPWSGSGGWQMGMIDAIKRSRGLTYTEGGKFNLHTDEWRQLLSLVIKGYTQEYLSPAKAIDPIFYNGELFREDQAAMVYQYFENSYEKGYRLMDEINSIGYIREPIGSSYSASSFRINGVFSVNKQANHPNEAMEFIRFINSDELVRTNLHRMYGIPARTDLIPESRREALSSILQIDVNAENLIGRDEIFTVSPGIPYIVSFELEKAFKQLVDQKVTLDDAITQIEKGAQAKLDEYLSTGIIKCLC